MKNDIAVIQGAGQGIGLALVAHILKHKKHTTVVATSRAPIESSALQKLSREYRSRLILEQLDVSEEKSIVSTVDKIAPLIEHISLLLNCSGVLHNESLSPEKKLNDICARNLALSHKINTIGPILVVKHFRKFIKREKKSIIANMSARVGSITDNRLGGWYSYRASKAALNQLTKTLAIELGRQLPKTICIALHPGSVNTRLSRPFQKAVPEGRLFETDVAATQTIEVLENLTTKDTGTFVAWDGSKIPW